MVYFISSNKQYLDAQLIKTMLIKNRSLHRCMPSVSKNGEFPRVRHSVNINEMMWGPLKLPLHVRLRLKIAPASWHVMLGLQVAGKTDYPGQATGALFSLNLTFKGSFKLPLNVRLTRERLTSVEVQMGEVTKRHSASISILEARRP